MFLCAGLFCAFARVLLERVSLETGIKKERMGSLPFACKSGVAVTHSGLCWDQFEENRPRVFVIIVVYSVDDCVAMGLAARVSAGRYVYKIT